MHKHFTKYALPALLLVAVWVNSSCPQPLAANILEIQHSDKLLHFLLYGLIATAIYRMPILHDYFFTGMLIAILLTSLFGAVDELHQYFVPGRSADYQDWLADTIGAIIAMIAYAKLDTYRKFLEFEVIKPKKLHQTT